MSITLNFQNNSIKQVFVIKLSSVQITCGFGDRKICIVQIALVKTFTRRISKATDLSITSFNETRKVILNLSMLVHVQCCGVGCQ